MLQRKLMPPMGAREVQQGSGRMTGPTKQQKSFSMRAPLTAKSINSNFLLLGKRKLRSVVYEDGASPRKGVLAKRRREIRSGKANVGSTTIAAALLRSKMLQRYFSLHGDENVENSNEDSLALEK